MRDGKHSSSFPRALFLGIHGSHEILSGRLGPALAAHGLSRVVLEITEHARANDDWALVNASNRGAA
ncbi:MAG TPA: hypothetical protein VG963_17970 [Polyangiaceae bacterium]|nr:hypothetical protein [Polyangiaceae bacterium]